MLSRDEIRMTGSIPGQQQPQRRSTLEKIRDSLIYKKPQQQEFN
jgi:hypothetical protein